MTAAGFLAASFWLLIVTYLVCSMLTERSRQHTERARLAAESAVRRAELQGITDARAKSFEARADAIEKSLGEAREKLATLVSKVNLGR
jgi:hypothetical protein